MGKYKLLIFDMDGTILDTLKDLTLSTNYALKKCGLALRSENEVRSFVGNGIRKLIERAVPENCPKETITKVFSVFNDYYKNHCFDFTKSYPGITDMLKKLTQKGYKTAVLSTGTQAVRPPVFRSVSNLNKFFQKKFFPGKLDTSAEKPLPLLWKIHSFPLAFFRNRCYYIDRLPGADVFCLR